MRLRIVALAAATFALAGCEEIDGLVAVSGVPSETASLTGRWVGQFSSSAAVFPGQAVLDLTQTGGSVTGTLTINGSRTANFAGTVSGTRLTGNWSYTDLCDGTANTTADVLQNGNRLSGTYTSSDCQGFTTGGYQLDRQSQ